MSRSSRTSSPPRSPRSIRKILLLLNPGKPRRSAAAFSAASQAFSSPVWSLDTHTPASTAELAALARRAARRGYWACLVAGGDGTLNHAAGALAGSTCRLGLIPTGTGNGFARSLGLPLDAPGACAVAAAGRIAKLDLLQLDQGRRIVSVGGVGLDAQAALLSERWRALGRVSGFLRYFLASLATLVSYRPSRIQLRIDGRRFEGRWWLVCLANGPQYGLGVSIAPGARLDDGRMDIVALEPSGLMTTARNFIRLLAGRQLLRCLRVQGRRCEVRSLDGRSLPVHCDGEPSGAAPLRASVRKGALRVLIP